MNVRSYLLLQTRERRVLYVLWFLLECVCIEYKEYMPFQKKIKLTFKIIKIKKYWTAENDMNNTNIHVRKICRYFSYFSTKTQINFWYVCSLSVKFFFFFKC